MATSQQAQQFGRKKTRRPRKDIGAKLYRHELEALREVEGLVAHGKTYEKARAEVSKKHGVGTRTLSRGKTLAADLDIMVNQPMALWRSLGHVLEGDNPFRQPPKKFSLDRQILPAVNAVFDASKVTKISSNNLVAALVTSGVSTWVTCNRGKPVSERQLAIKLSKFGIRPRKIRQGSKTMNGYHLKQFQYAFKRYLPSSTHVTNGTIPLE
ncbi:DUF3631 domain-containing protein [Pseudomonas sp. PD9R]|uniref:DUF3631 domain-containing protein n=1 Tax=Pseudomonas sp. PD9R TaxID=2853534 RepID=UPI001C44F449|nr:DUF3631 domain-containing protein [Pseudomonas sp. PD9R]MBV6824495.1 DUF3631 domain-containing protein [Pseudomonas sp. PD9R]